MMENVENVTRLDEEAMETVSGGVKLRENNRTGAFPKTGSGKPNAMTKFCEACGTDVEYNEFSGGRCYCKACGALLP